MKKFWIILFSALILSACGGTQTVKPKAPTASPAQTPQAPAAAPAASANKKGGYYLDDGPGDNPPADIDSIPDAIPHAELPLTRANKPYSALGTRYTPMTEYAPYKQSGIASWYGRRYHGQKTSSGEIYDMYGMTGAHTTLPLPSYAKVTNTSNGRSVIVRINDRGPFHSDRVIDLSYAAAYKLRLHEKGSGMVEVEAIDTRISTMVKLPTATSTVTPSAAPASPVAKVAEPVVTTAPLTIEKTLAVEPVALPSSVAEIKSEPEPVTNTELAKATEMSSGDYIQLAAFKTRTNAELLVSKVKQQALNAGVPVFSWYNNDVYKVRVGPYSNRADAELASKKIGPSLNVKPVIVHVP